MAPAAPRTVEVVTAPEETLFETSLPAALLRAMVLSAKAVSDMVYFELDSNGERAVRYWAIDADRATAMVGQPEETVFASTGGDGEPHTIQVGTAHLQQKVAALDPKRPVEFSLIRQGKQHTFLLRQARSDDDEPDNHRLSVELSEEKPIAPVIGKGAYAGVNLRTFNKILAGLTKNADIVTLAVRPGIFEVTTSTRRLHDEWTHATSTDGKATGIYATKFLKRIVGGALKVAEVGDVYLVGGQPLHVSAQTEEMTVNFYVADRIVANRDMMK